MDYDKIWEKLNEPYKTHMLYYLKEQKGIKNTIKALAIKSNQPRLIYALYKLS